MTKKQLISLVYELSLELAIAIDNQEWVRVQSVFNTLQDTKKQLNKG